MKFCSKCGAQLEDDAALCPRCGQPCAGANFNVDVYDHTAEFDAKDVSENKVVAMLPYLLDIVGVLLAAILATDSPYTRFHVRTALKYTVCTVLIGIVSAVLAITVIVPICGAIAAIVIFVLRIISFVQVCEGKAKDPVIIRSLGFLK